MASVVDVAPTWKPADMPPPASPGNCREFHREVEKGNSKSPDVKPTQTKKNSDKKRTSSNKSKKKDPDTASQTTKEGTQDLRNNKKSKKIHLEEASEATTIPKAGEFEVEEERKSKHSDRRLKPSQRAKDAADTA
mmetsp:Transcript_16147/g.19097  ORF Transcript_16147/g.19097 Transcript_16147/m.19097 type:complete len:135 (+) Transcript_16147:222-626(+)